MCQDSEWFIIGHDVPVCQWVDTKYAACLKPCEKETHVLTIIVENRYAFWIKLFIVQIGYKHNVMKYKFDFGVDLTRSFSFGLETIVHSSFNREVLGSIPCGGRLQIFIWRWYTSVMFTLQSVTIYLMPRIPLYMSRLL